MIYDANTSQTHLEDHRSECSFYHKVKDLWSALFNIEESLPDASLQHPPSFILQALDFLLPVASDLSARQRRWESTLRYTVESKDLDAAKFVTAMTAELKPKLVVVYGTIHPPDDACNSIDPSRALFVVLTSSPPWCRYSEGMMDYLVGTEHVILQLAPQARVLWCPHEHAKYVDMLHLTADSISFGLSRHSPTTDSGFVMNFGSGLLTLCSSGKADDGYVEIEIGPVGSARPKSEPQVWQTVANIEKVELYNVSGGVREDLEKLRHL